MTKSAHQTIYLKDYQVPNYLLQAVALHFDLSEEATLVESCLNFYRNPQTKNTSAPLELVGEALQLLSVELDGKILDQNAYQVTEKSLLLLETPDSGEIKIKTKINPKANTALSGLYLSNKMFCTQCEAQGFRRITYFLDRPDVLTTYTTTITADKNKYPVLLSNGNLIASGETKDNRHWVTWQDPFKKPSYLFALVAGGLVHIEDTFTTCSARDIALKIYTEKGNEEKCWHAMASLKAAMKWDEQVYKREYDLDIFMIVAVSDFNMGAMENKGLNIFNMQYILANPETATDADYEAITSVVGHEYFHNWSGNRVTCRDWFQLSLKEGLTVYREQEFAADQHARDVSRIDDVQCLRTHQFPEDDSPMAHPVRPAAYMEINNFYTSTVYNKGAEVIRMLHNLLGTEKFFKGMDYYFATHDGQAVTTEDFVKSMEIANKCELSQFRLWYSQAGTPQLKVKTNYDAKKQSFEITIEQSCPATPGQKEKKPFHIPLAIGLLDSQGDDCALQLEGEPPEQQKTLTLQIKKPVEKFHFVNLPDKPVVSLLRGFSAPVKIIGDYSDADLMFLLSHDNDGFARWEAGQQLSIKIILNLISDYQNKHELAMNEAFLKAYEKVLLDQQSDKRLIAKLLMLPSEQYLAEQMTVIDVEAIHAIRHFIQKTLATQFHKTFLALYQENRSNKAYRYDNAAVSQRCLQNVALSYLAKLGNQEVKTLCLEHFNQADNMTDALAALRELAHHDCAERETVLESFYQRWQHDALVLDKWFGIQAMSELPDTLIRVKELMQHRDFELTNPNKVRALIGTFCRNNVILFHAANGEGYEFLAEQILQLNQLNPQIAARLTSIFSQWQKYDAKRQALMKKQLERLLAHKGLSRDVYEIVSKSLRAMPLRCP